MASKMTSSRTSNIIFPKTIDYENHPKVVNMQDFDDNTFVFLLPMQEPIPPPHEGTEETFGGEQVYGQSPEKP